MKSNEKIKVAQLPNLLKQLGILPALGSHVFCSLLIRTEKFFKLFCLRL